MDVLQMPTYHYDIDEDRRLAHEAHVTLCAFGLLHDKTVVEVHEEAQTEALWTAPPPHLTESDLISLMETHGIGTDASMATHISNVERRGYVTLDGGTRQLVPSALGLALIHAYTLIDEGLVLPCVRAGMEAQVRRIAKGEASLEQVVGGALRNFESRYHHFVRKAHLLPLMLAVALAHDNPAAPSADLHSSSSLRLAGSQLWEEAQRRTALISLSALLDPTSPLSQSALRLPMEATSASTSTASLPSLSPSLSLPPGTRGGEIPATAGLPGAPRDEEAEEGGAEIITGVQRQLEALGFGPPAGTDSGGGRASGGGGGGGGAAEADTGSQKKKKNAKSKGGRGEAATRSQGAPQLVGSAAVVAVSHGVSVGVTRVMNPDAVEWKPF